MYRRWRRDPQLSSIVQSLLVAAAGDAGTEGTVVARTADTDQRLDVDVAVGVAKVVGSAGDAVVGDCSRDGAVVVDFDLAAVEKDLKLGTVV